MSVLGRLRRIVRRWLGPRDSGGHGDWDPMTGKWNQWSSKHFTLSRKDRHTMGVNPHGVFVSTNHRSHGTLSWTLYFFRQEGFSVPTTLTVYSPSQHTLRTRYDSFIRSPRSLLDGTLTDPISQTSCRRNLREDPGMTHSSCVEVLIITLASEN